jgi:hypothetical protein
MTLTKQKAGRVDDAVGLFSFTTPRVKPDAQRTL